MTQGPVESFAHCPKCGVPRTLGSGNRFDCNSCGYVLYFNQGSAVAVILHDPAGRVLFLRRQRDPGRGQLGLPGGFIDPGESGEEALVREVYEETALELKEWRYLASFPNRYAYKGILYQVTDLFYISEIENFDGITADTTEVAGWFPAIPAEVLQTETFAFESNRRALELFASSSLARS